ncbi:MAG: squalene/phytoene synthase family protein [Boseongicola sp.]|nr:squalene/phytoene synthase family protein [Boseongicola sp.]
MSIQACADIVAKADPDRFQAAMAAPVEARRVLFPIYAFNAEVARAPWVTDEPMIAEMRLQWWRDALEEVADERPVRKHEVTTTLSEVLDTSAAKILDRLIQSRRWDIYKDPFEDDAHFHEYLDQTGGGLMWVSARLLGAPENSEASFRSIGAANALARFLQAIPELEAKGRVPLVDGRPETVRNLATSALEQNARAMRELKRLDKTARGAVLEAWQALPVLRQVAQNPNRVSEGRLGLSPIRKRFRLLRWA